MSNVPRIVVVKIATLKLRYAEGDRDEADDLQPHYLAEMSRAKKQHGAGDDLERDVEYLVEVMTGMSDEGIAETIKDYLDDDDDEN
jgi:hypothetical protein